MSHFAKVLDGKVIQVIVAEPEFFDTFVDSSPGQWIQTSYNTRGNVYHGETVTGPLQGSFSGETVRSSGTPLRGNYAGIGYTYDYENDVFYAPQPFPSWTLSNQTWTWEPPIPYPLDGVLYVWDEPTTSWVQIPEGV